MFLQQRKGPTDAYGLVVFDFDETLAATDVGIFHLDDVTDRVFGGIDRKLEIESMLHNLQLKGFATAIVSYNQSSTIISALEHLKHHFFEVLGWDDLTADSSVDSSKSTWIRRLMGACNIDESAPICFVDDNKYNIQDVKKHLPDCHTIYVEGGNGMREEHFQEVLTFTSVQIELAKLDVEDGKYADAKKFFEVDANKEGQKYQ